MMMDLSGRRGSRVLVYVRDRTLEIELNSSMKINLKTKLSMELVEFLVDV